MRLINFCLVLLVCGGFAACSSTPKFDARTALPCDIFTSADATELVGKAVHQTMMGSVPDLQQADYVSCTYLTQQAPPSGISFTVFGRRNFADGQKFYRTTQAESVTQKTYLPVSSIGDEAFWNGTSLLVRQGNQVIGITAASEGQNNLNMAKAVALKVLERLK